MISAPLPKSEQDRILTLQNYAVLDSDEETLFDDITFVAAEICEVPIALISLIDSDRQWFKSRFGLDAKETPRNIAFCAHAILSDEIIEIPDAKLDPRFEDNPLVTGAPYIRFYAGAPLIAPNGEKIGTLCVIDREPKRLDDKQKNLLKVLARDVVAQLEIRNKTQALKESQELQTLINETNQDLIFVKDEEFKIVYANKAFMNIYPKELHDKVLGFTTIEEYSPEQAEFFLTQDRIAFEKGKSQIVETIHLPNKEKRVLNSTKQRFTSVGGQRYILCVSHDITERELLMDELKQTNRDLDDFAYIASHDLKAPLNAVKRLLEWIKEDCEHLLPEDSLENFHLAIGRVNRMHKLLKDLLSYARINKSYENSEVVNLTECVNSLHNLLDVPDSFTITAESKVIVVPRIPLETIIRNLISNSIKHHHQESGTIKITCDETKAEYILTVSDDGPGIEQKYHQKVFELFQTLKPRDTVEGSGMGLSVVKRLTEHYGGSVNISANKPSGTVFTIHWPKENVAKKIKETFND
ncbi:sensor histidine kinase [Flocculibacter collagenilyticus]|uniref:sensor histidine kinase n=1 Tax=Flocculibacter collagenilyticus TaxID=2744479 RepID=UPI0018F66FD3|nr:ATP-binding protein [Flocculibacter collagenilyticus]